MTRTSKLLTACVMSLTIGGELAAYAATLPQLPQKQVDVTMPTVNGTTFNATCATFQAQLNAAAAANINLTHQVILGPAGTVCTGNFFLPAHSGGTGWIIITGPNGGVKPAGTRVGVADAASMPSIQYNAGNQNVAISANANAQRYRFIGIQFIDNPAQTPNYRYICIGLLSDGCGGTNTGYIIFDRIVCRDLSSPHHTSKCIQADSTVGNIALIDSTIVGIGTHGAASADAQCLQSDINVGPILIRNNYLSAAGENVMFGGGNEASISAYVPQNITIQYNDFDLPAEFRAGSGYGNVKALLEFKEGVRILVEGNRFTNLDYTGEGYVMRLTVRNSLGPSVASELSDLTIRYNKFVNNTNGYIMLPADVPGTGGSVGPTKHSQRWYIHDNLMYGTGAVCGGGAHCGVIMQISGGNGQTMACTDAPACYLQDFTYAHNTHNANAMEKFISNSSIHNLNLDFRDNIVNVQNAYGFLSADLTPFTLGTAAMNLTWGATWSWRNNLMANIGNGDSSSSYPQGNGNLYLASISNVLFTNPAGHDYSLQAGSPAKNAASDGTDQGVNFTAFNAAQAGSGGGGGGGDLTPPGVPQNVSVR